MWFLSSNATPLRGCKPSSNARHFNESREVRPPKAMLAALRRSGSPRTYIRRRANRRGPRWATTSIERSALRTNSMILVVADSGANRRVSNHAVLDLQGCLGDVAEVIAKEAVACPSYNSE